MPWSKDDEEKLFWYLVAAYIADVLGILDKKKRAKLSHLAERSGEEATWQEQVEGELSITPAFIRALFDLSTGYTGGSKSKNWALGFILQGLGCPDAEQRLTEVFA